MIILSVDASQAVHGKVLRCLQTNIFGATLPIRLLFGSARQNLTSLTGFYLLELTHRRMPVKNPK